MTSFPCSASDHAVEPAPPLAQICTISQNGLILSIFGIRCPLLNIYSCYVALPHRNFCKSLSSPVFQQRYLEQHPPQRPRSHMLDCFLYFPRSLQLVDNFIQIGGPKRLGLSMSTQDHVKLAFSVYRSNHLVQFELLFRSLDKQTFDKFDKLRKRVQYWSNVSSMFLRFKLVVQFLNRVVIVFVISIVRDLPMNLANSGTCLV